MVCNRVTAQRVSIASLCLSHFFPFFNSRPHSLRMCYGLCLQLCRRCICLTITKMSRDNKREMKRQRNREFSVPLVTSCKLVALFHCSFPGTSLRTQAFYLHFNHRNLVLVFIPGPQTTSVPEVGYSNYPAVSCFSVLNIAD